MSVVIFSRNYEVLPQTHVHGLAGRGDVTKTG